MIDTLRRYWIGLLVLVLVGLHATIIGVIRFQAVNAKVSATCEVDLGSFQVMQPTQNASVQLRVHAVVPAAHRLQARAVFEAQQWEIRQTVEECLRQMDPALLQNPYLDDVKSQVYDVLVQTIGEEHVDRVLVTEMTPSPGTVLVFTKAPPRKPAKKKHGEHDSEGHEGDHGSDGHGAEHGDSHDDSHGGDSHGGGHGGGHEESSHGGH